MRRTLHLLNGLVVFFLGTVSLADDITIDRVDVMSQGSKSSTRRLIDPDHRFSASFCQSSNVLTHRTV